MLKMLIIVGIVAYVLYKVGSFLFKIGAAAEQLKRNQSGTGMPGNDKKGRKKPNIQGEYIDYEEVK